MRIEGILRPPSDKSITHRALMLAAAAQTPSCVKKPLLSGDTLATLRCLMQLGLKVEAVGSDELLLVPASKWKEPLGPLDCANSGTTMRLLAGLLASRSIRATLIGDASLSRRPMDRIARPLRLMGAKVYDELPPLRIEGGPLKGIEYVSEIPSAQVKSCVLLASLRADGETWLQEPRVSRDHTERMLKTLGVPLKQEGHRVGLRGGACWEGFECMIPGDLSSTAYAIVMAALLPDSFLLVKDVGMNPTRTGILEVLRSVGVCYEVTNLREHFGEPLADLTIWGSDVLKPFCIEKNIVPRLIDEVPILAVLATQCEGVSEFRGLQELRVKESDRILKMSEGLRSMGAKVEVFEDGFAITGPTELKGARINPAGDHRIAMAFTVAGFIANGETIIEGRGCIATSYPGFTKQLREVCVF